jgi:WASH complex subunit strumpellin
MTEEFVLENMGKLIHCVRECNSTVRWLMLQTNTKNQQLLELLTLSGFNFASQIMLFLLNAAQVEYDLKRITVQLMETRQQRWSGYRKQTNERMTELGTSLSRVTWTPKILRACFSSRLFLRNKTTDSRDAKRQPSCVV